MRRSRPLEFGLVAGCLAGIFTFVIRDTHRTVPMQMTYPPHYSGAMLREAMKQPAQPQRPRRRLFDLDRRGWYQPHADLNTCWLERSNLRGANLSDADLRQSWLIGCDFRDANLEHADLTGATYDEDCRWPEGFHQIEHGAMILEAPEF